MSDKELVNATRKWSSFENGGVEVGGGGCVERSALRFFEDGPRLGKVSV